jgi:hypothetical protein
MSAFDGTCRPILGSVPQPPGTGAGPHRSLPSLKKRPIAVLSAPRSSGRENYPITTGGTDKTMTTVERSNTAVEVVLGVDTHLDSHVAVALDQLGRPLGDLSVPTTPDGYRTLLVSWAVGFGSL